MSDISTEWVIEKGSRSGHCCFEYSIVNPGDDDEAICECFNLSDAELILSFLNGGNV